MDLQKNFVNILLWHETAEMALSLKQPFFVIAI